MRAILILAVIILLVMQKFCDPKFKRKDPSDSEAQ
jgi:hypothetical protein